MIVRLFSALIICLVCTAMADAAGELKGEYQVLQLKKSLFQRGITMLPREQDEYAGYLGRYAGVLVAQAEGDQQSLDQARRILALSFHLSPQNGEMKKVTKALAAGELPSGKRMYYGAKALSRLLHLRAELLESEGGEKDLLLARYFYQLAYQMDPKNREARDSHSDDLSVNGVLDWSVIEGEK